MIKLYVIYTMPFLTLALVQYLLVEKTLLLKPNKIAFGYCLSVLLYLVSAVYAVYLRFFVPYMEALGLAAMILSFYLFFKFVKKINLLAKS